MLGGMTIAFLLLRFVLRSCLRRIVSEWAAGEICIIPAGARAWQVQLTTIFWQSRTFSQT